MERACASAIGAIDHGVSSIEEVHDLLIWSLSCTPVQLIADAVQEAAKHVLPGALITDVGSTKATHSSIDRR